MQKKLSKSNAVSLESILEEIHYLSSIVNKLLLLHSLDTNEEKYSFKVLDVGSIVHDLVDDARILARKKNIGIQLQGSGKFPVNGNEELVGQMIWNILDNAIKYTPAKGKVWIRTEKQDQNVIVAIQDTGIGIPQEAWSKIFTRFYRAEQSHSREVVGSGLGLAISKWIAELHKGSISVQSQVDNGSTFTVTLPLLES